ncbi:MAG: glycosyltransferase family 39 protein, partial [Methanobacterium formicicum]|uniref:glycosyltransferase family 39 protein n=1 Tax=Methanobacterium formicicum TaxID=2162 RepID=UPI0035309BE0
MAKKFLQNLIFPFYKDKRVILFIVILFYLSLSFVLLGHYLHVFNDDSISYLTIANEYEDGNFSAAINGYWSPLFSWLMVPFFIFSSSVLGDLIAARLISVIIGLFTLMGVYLLINNLGFDRKTMIATLFVMIPVVLSFVFFLLTPDLLLTCCLIYYIAFLTDSDYYSKLKLGLLSGFAGGLAFLSKSYVFVFFPVHFILSNIYYLKSR